MSLKKPLILASNKIPKDYCKQIASDSMPRLDYMELTRALGGDLLDTHHSSQLSEWQQKMQDKLSSDISQASKAWGRRGLYNYCVSTSEKVGIPLALIDKFRGRKSAPKHILIAHNLMSKKKRILDRFTHILENGFSDIICLSSCQKNFLIKDGGIPEQRVHLFYHNIDTRFFQPIQPSMEGEYILAVGREERDYSTLVAASARLSLPVKIVASSLWAKDKQTDWQGSLPPNVTLLQEFVRYPKLRELYDNARIVVLPLQASNYASGATGLLEAMSMGKAVIATRTDGLENYLLNQSVVKTVEAGETESLIQAVEELWSDKERRIDMGDKARQLAVKEMSIELYVENVAAIVKARISEEG